jgi:hypothetical protein
MEHKTFLCDFDGTLQLHSWPYLDKPVPHAIRVIKRLMEAEHCLILYTMRNDDDLEDAKNWLKEHDLHFDHFNCNPNFETGSRKIYAHYIIDDHDLCCPLIYNPEIHQKPFVDWLAIEKILEEKGLI